MNDAHREDMWGEIVAHYLASKTQAEVDVYLTALCALATTPRSPQIEEGVGAGSDPAHLAR